jgi:hypothetical protein
MKSMNPIIPVFVGSPSEVRKERKMTESAIQSLAPRFASLFGVTLIPLLWEQFAPISSFDATHPGIGILRRIQPFSIFVGILWNTCGQTVPESGKTGTEMEFEHVIKNRETIIILSYFRRQTKGKSRSRTMQTQQNNVIRLRKKLEKQNLTTINYNSSEEFQQRILPDIMEACIGLVLAKEPKKITDYYKFFRFGSHFRISTGPLLIVYPPITDPGLGYKKPKLDWHKRLLPHVIYEDFKAIQDIEEAMRLLGRDYKTVTTDSPRLNVAEPGDRVWVCIPRNKKAQLIFKQLDRQGTKIRFRFEPRRIQKELETCLIWNIGKKEIVIPSPLSKYLRASSRPAGNQEWRPSYGHSYCRDYAIFARFKLFKDFEEQDGEYFYHYFIGGIRGLGTWGVGYLIDHNSSKLVRIANKQMNYDGNVQMLLEVIYENFRIKEVNDISDKKESFFKERYSDVFINKQLNGHSNWLSKTYCEQE